MPTSTNIAVIGAGPYGLSLATYLRARGLDYRIIGIPMEFWLTQMPKGMLLKSEGFASNIYDPKESFPLRTFCQEQGIPYDDLGLPVAVETFSSYGVAFQKRMVPQVEEKILIAIERSPSGFNLQLNDGEAFTAHRIVLATGISQFREVPEQLIALPRELVSHSSEHHDLERFRGRDVTVIGGGASAIDLAALLHECGAQVKLVARRDSIKFHGRTEHPRPVWERIRYPLSGIGPGWRSRICSDFPQLFRFLPADTRTYIVKKHLGPAGGWFMKNRFAPVELIPGQRILRADEVNGKVQLDLVSDDGAMKRISTEHVIAATGFKVDLFNLPFLSSEIKCKLKSVGNAPVLSSYFQSSVPGLYFVGAASANSFGPLMRFAVGSKFAARRIAKHLAGQH